MRRNRLNPAIGQQIFSLGGAALGAGLGALVGNPALGLRIGRAVGGVAGSLYYARRSAAQRDRLQKQRVQTASLGEPIKRIFGTAIVAGNIIWSTDIDPYPVAGGEEYRVSFAVGFGAGVASKFLRIWADGQLVYSAAANTTGEYAVPPAYSNKLAALYLGTETQTADPTIEEYEGAGNVHGFRGLIYAVWRELPLRAFGNRIPTIEAEIAMTSSQQFEKEEVSTPNILSGDIDRFVLSETEPRLFAFVNAGVLLNLNRASLAYLELDVNAKMEAMTGSGDTEQSGYLAIDEEGSSIGPTVWFCGLDTSTSESFICKHVPGTAGFTTNYSDRVEGNEIEIFVKGDHVFTADDNGAHVRCYDKHTKQRLWTRNGPLGPSGNAVPGNFTYDNYGRLWLISWVAADPATGVGSRFFLSRITTGGVVNHYTFSDQGRAKSIAYDLISDSIGGFLYAGGGDSFKLFRISVPSAAAPAINSTLNGVSGPNSRPCFTSQYRFFGGQGGSFFLTDGIGGDFYEIKISSFTATSLGTHPDWSLTGTYGGFGYDKLHRGFWLASSTDDKFYLCKTDRFAATNPTLGSVLNSICQRTGLTSGEIDTSAAALSSITIKGFVIGDRMTAREALESLLLPYFVDVRENYTASNIKLQFVQRTGSAVDSIAEAELGAGEGEPEEVTFLIERTPEQELPRRVTLRYISYDRDYDEAEVSAQLRTDTATSTNEIDIAIPLVLSDDEAKAIVDSLLMVAWSEANAVRLALNWEHCRLEAADPIVVTYNGDAYRIRLSQVEHGANRLIEAVGVVETTSAYTSLADADANTLPTAPTPTVPSGTQLFFLDLPCLRDSDDVPGPYLAVAPLSEGTGASWVGATIYRSTDGLSWVPVFTVGRAAVAWGYLTSNTPLADFQAGRWDRTNTIDLQMVRGTLSAATEEELTADRQLNLLAVGSVENGWELIQFADVADNGLVNGQRNYTLSRLIRGRFGSEAKAATHQTGEIALLLNLDAPTIFKLETAIEAVTQTYYYKVVTAGNSPANVGSESHIDTGLCLKPYAVSDPVSVQNWPSAGDWTFTWQRRSRVGHDLQDYEDVPLGEASERYEIDLRESSISPLLRTVSVSEYGDTGSFTLSVDGATSKVVRAGSWITSLFYLGQIVELSGFSNADNNGRFRVIGLTATDMTLRGPRALVTEGSAAGRRVRAVSPGMTYTAAQQTADGGSKSFLYYEIFQLSDRLELADGSGRGLVKIGTTS